MMELVAGRIVEAGKQFDEGGSFLELLPGDARVAEVFPAVAAGFGEVDELVELGAQTEPVDLGGGGYPAVHSGPLHRRAVRADSGSERGGRVNRGVGEVVRRQRSSPLDPQPGVLPAQLHELLMLIGGQSPPVPPGRSDPTSSTGNW